MARAERVICTSADLVEAGDGVRFEVTRYGAVEPAFAIRFGGKVHAYLNRCAHVPVELDWIPGKFFDGEGMVLLCSTHGAMYDPATGGCLGGPCGRGALRPLTIEERDGKVMLKDGNDG